MNRIAALWASITALVTPRRAAPGELTFPTAPSTRTRDVAPEFVAEEKAMVTRMLDRLRVAPMKSQGGPLHYVHKGHRHAAARRARVMERMTIVARKSMTMEEFNNEPRGL